MLYRATTPIHMFWFYSLNPENLYRTIRLTYSQDGSILVEKEKSDLTFGVTQTSDGSDCYYMASQLTQNEANLFSSESGSPIEIQIRCVDYGGHVDATNILRITALDVLNDEVL